MDELQAAINIGGRNTNNLRRMDDTTLMAESKDELKSLLIRVKEESERAGLKLSIKNLIHDFQPYYFMANRGGKGGSSDRLPLLGLRNHCRWWLQPWNQKTFASWQESMTNLDHVLKSRDSTLPTKVFGLPSGHIRLWQLDHKGGGALKNWCLQTMVLEKTAERCLDSKEIKPVNLKGNQPEYLLEGLMLKLKLQYLGQLMRRTDSFERPWCWERLKAGEEGMIEDEMVG